MLAAVRVVLVLVIFLVVERVCHSSRAGGIAVLVYAAGPQFYGFDTQYAYETLALAFAAAAVYLLFVSIDAEQPRIGRSFALALGCIGALVLTHHVTGWLTVGFLVVWAVGLYGTVYVRRRATHTGWGPAMSYSAAGPNPTGKGPSAVPKRMPQDPLSKRKTQARIVGIAAAVGLVLGGTWTAFVGRRLTDTWILCLRPRLRTSARHWATFTGTESFKNAAGGGSPRMGDRPPAGSCHKFLRDPPPIPLQRGLQANHSRWSASLYTGSHRRHLSADGGRQCLVEQQAGGRAGNHVHLLRHRWSSVHGWEGGCKGPAKVERGATLVVATVIFLGSLLYGGGPPPSLLPGPYHVGGDPSLGPPRSPPPSGPTPTSRRARTLRPTTTTVSCSTPSVASTR